MSRDWTPREHYFADLYMQREYKSNFREESLNMVISYQGKEEAVYTEEDKKILRKYIELGFLFSRNLLSLYKRTEEHPIRRNRMLNELELQLEEIIKLHTEKVALEDYPKYIDEYLLKWFLGELDKNFYYNSRNNKIFEDYLFQKIMIGK